MKQIRIEFIADQRWKWLWMVTTLVVVGCLGGMAWQWQKDHRTLEDGQQRSQALDAQLQKLRTPTILRKDPRTDSALKAAELLQQDLNKVFAVMENVQVQGVQLRGVSLDTSSGTLRLDYELDGLSKAALVTDALNAGYEQRPWKLDSVSVSTPGGRGMPSVAANSFGQLPGMYRGTWSVRLASL